MGGGGGPLQTAGGGGGWQARGAAMLPSLSEAIGLPGDLVQEVPVRAGGDAAEDG